MKARMCPVSALVLVLAVGVHWITADSIMSYKHQSVKRIDFLKRCHLPFQIRPPPQG